MKYIDADLLRKRIEENKYVIEPMFVKGDDCYYEGEYDGYNRILDIIDSLQQEQSEVDDIKREWYNKGYIKGRQEAHIPAKELGLPKAFDFKPLDEDLERDAVSFCYDNGLNTTPHIAKTIAKHFYELGFNAEK